MHNSESVLENETPKLLRNFAMNEGHLISARRPDKVIVNNNNKKKKRKKKERELAKLCISQFRMATSKTERKRKEG